MSPSAHLDLDSNRASACPLRLRFRPRASACLHLDLDLELPLRFSLELAMLEIVGKQDDLSALLPFPFLSSQFAGSAGKQIICSLLLFHCLLVSGTLIKRIIQNISLTTPNNPASNYCNQKYVTNIFKAILHCDDIC